MRLLSALPVLAVPVVLGCLAASTSPSTPVAIDTASTPAAPQGLKPPSELALLMRQMVQFSDSTRARLQRGAELLPYPEQFARIHTATPTDGKLEMDRTTFDAFADHYLTQVKALYDAQPADRQRVFNGTLNGCTNCHTVVCPGPMMKIKKMYVPVM